MNRSELGWYAVTCRPQSELTVRAAFRSRGVEVVVPTETRSIRHREFGGRRRLVKRVIVPGYVLLPARSHASAWAMIHEHPALRKTLGDRPLSDLDMRRLSEWTGREVVWLDVHGVDRLVVGAPVVIQVGPQPWTTGVLHSLFGDVAGVLMRAFGGQLVVRVPLANLARA
jgi:transcription antitermination factor NusG